MTKQEIDKLFECIIEDDIEGCISFIKNEELKNKIHNYNDEEEFLEKEKESIGKDIYLQVPTELLDYFCERAIFEPNEILTSFIKQIENDDKKIEIIRLDDNDDFKVEIAMSIKDDDKKIELLQYEDIFEDLNNEVKVVASIKDDDKKISLLDLFESEYDKAEIIKSINDDDKKIELLAELKGEHKKIIVIKSVKDDNKKIALLNELENPYNKSEIIITIEDDDKKIALLKEIEDKYSKEEIVKSIKNDDKKIALLDEFESQEQKIRIIREIKSDDKKIQLLGKFKDEESKFLIIETIKNDDKKIMLLDEFQNENYKIEIIKSIKNNIKKLEAYYKIGYKPDNVMAVKDILESRNNIKVMNKYSNNATKTLGLPKEMTIGVELETEGEFSAVLLKKRTIMNDWKSKYDGSIKKGVEVVSPILHDTEEDMKSLEIICNAMQKAGFVATEKCGGHIHIGAEYLENNPQALENLTTIWNECEELFYKMANEKGVIPREGIKTYAKTSHSYIEEMFPEGKIEIKDQSDFEEICSVLTAEEQKYWGLNLGHYGEKDKNTIEFRMPNGTINPQTVKENIKLFGSLMQVSKEMALNPEYKKEEFNKIKDRGLTEGEKEKALLNLLFKDEKTKNIFWERWDSVKDEHIFEELSGSGTPTFERGNYKIASKEEFEKVAKNKEAILEMSDVVEEIRSQLKERDEQKQI